jgi:putative transposase
MQGCRGRGRGLVPRMNADESLSDEQPPSVRVVQWPHAPPHRLGKEGTYFVTAGTYQKAHVFKTQVALQLLHDSLLAHSADHGWQLEAWAVFPNHYHFVARPQREGMAKADLGAMIARLHKHTASAVNAMDGTTGRRVWHSFRETLLTFEKSWLARLNYTHQNAVKHGLVVRACDYPWCSAAWFERTAAGAWRETVYSFKTDRMEVGDEF